MISSLKRWFRQSLPMGVLAALLVAALGGAAGALLFLLMGGWLLGWRLPDTDVLLAIFTGLLVLFALLQYRVSRDVHVLTNTRSRTYHQSKR